jgi:chemotaxis protein CheC
MVKINEIQLDALREIINIGIGYSAGSLNKMLQQHIVMTVPELHLIDANDPSSFAKNTYSSRLSGIFQSFDGAYSGHAALLFPRDGANQLVSALTGYEPDDSELEILSAGSLIEVGNIVISGLFGSISNFLGSEHLKFTIPDYQEDTLDRLIEDQGSESNKDGVYLLAEVKFAFTDLNVEGFLLLFFTVGSVDVILQLIEKKMNE